MFDWMLTLADYPDEYEHLRRAHDRLGRPYGADDIDTLGALLRTTAQEDDVRTAAAQADCSADLHRAATMLHLDRAGIDEELAEAMYAILGHPSFHPVYPDVEPALSAIAGAGIAIAVISDFHLDLREHGRLARIDHLIDHWIISFEHRVQKPDPTIFELALAALGAAAEETLMVGDRASHDGAAAALGIDTFILPAPTDPPDPTDCVPCSPCSSDPDDGRATFTVVTPSGRDELRRAAPRCLSGIEEHFTNLFTAGEQAELTALLVRVADRHAEARAPH